MAERYKLIVLGTPCGGTNWAWNALRHHGLEMGHERKAGFDGRVCGFAINEPLVSSVREHRVLNVDAIEWQTLVQLVRHPLLVINTLWNYLKNRPGPWRPHTVSNVTKNHPDSEWTEDYGVIQGLRYWVIAHARIMERKPHCIVRLDEKHTADDWAQLMERLGVEDTALPKVDRGSKPRTLHLSQPMTWQRWRELDAGFAEVGRALVRALRLEEPEGLV